jgi:NAD(P)-dependent dehydrogenase (short-subunit alcohol dehydrogenase family)
LITGCSSGLGNALARKFVKAGYPTYASARRLESIEDLKREGCNTLRIDVTDHLHYVVSKDSTIIVTVKKVLTYHRQTDRESIYQNRSTSRRRRCTERIRCTY